MTLLQFGSFLDALSNGPQAISRAFMKPRFLCLGHASTEFSVYLCCNSICIILTKSCVVVSCNKSLCCTSSAKVSLFQTLLHPFGQGCILSSHIALIHWLLHSFTQCHTRSPSAAFFRPAFKNCPQSMPLSASYPSLLNSPCIICVLVAKGGEKKHLVIESVLNRLRAHQEQTSPATQHRDKKTFNGDMLLVC